MTSLHGSIAPPGIVRVRHEAHVCAIRSGTSPPVVMKVRLVMTYLNSSAKRTSGLWDRLMATVAEMKAAQRRRALYARTLRELEALTDKDLADLGISRLQIADVAREAAYGTH
jgi:uncharacterized protein YjiS (DUF1127 family)